MTDTLHTCVVHLKPDGGWRVTVDHLGGSHEEATRLALDIVSYLGRADHARLTARVIASDQITDVDSTLPTLTET